MPGYSAVLVLAVFDMGEVVVLAQIQLHRPAALVPVIDARASSNIISLSAVTNRTSALQLGSMLGGFK